MQLDLIVRNANIITMNPARPTAKSMGVLNGRICGFDEELDNCAADSEFDVQGAVITPGFIDAHCHTVWFGLGLSELDVSTARGLGALYTLIAAATKEHPGGWLVGSGFNQVWHEGQFPDIRELDRVTGEVPLFVRHNSGHMAIVNSAALAKVGALDPAFENPDGGVIVRDEQGKPTGLIQETAQRLFQDLILPYSRQQIEDALFAATSVYASQGITSFTEAGVGGGWIGHSPVEIAAYQSAAAKGKLRARAQVMPVIDVLHPVGAGETKPELFESQIGLDLGLHSGFGDDYLSLGPVKVFLDGSLLSETAALTSDYCSHGDHDNSGNRGYFQASPDEMAARIEAAYAAGWSVAIHAIGDGAVDVGIAVIRECIDKYGQNQLPNRIEHASLTRPEHIPLLCELGIAVTPQASFFHELGDAMVVSLGPDRTPWAYRGGSFLRGGVVLAGSSDRPVADGNPLRGMQAFVDRRTSSGALFGLESECLTPYEALAAYTVGAAAAIGAQASRGSLERGKLADFVVLSGSPLEARDISTLDVLATAVGGQFTFGAHA